MMHDFSTVQPTGSTPEDIAVGRGTGRVIFDSKFAFNGLLAAHYKYVVDMFRFQRALDLVKTLGDRIGEPVLMTMGRKINPVLGQYFEQLYVPCTAKTQDVFPDLIQESGIWTPAIQYQNGAPVVATEALRTALLMSGAPAGEKPEYELLTIAEQDRDDIEEHLATLRRRHGLRVRPDFEPRALHSDALPVGNTMPGV